MKAFCESIHMSEAVTEILVRLDSVLEQFPCQAFLMQEGHWEEGLQQLRDVLGEDPDGTKMLCCMLRCARKARETYDRLGISETIYLDTMTAFSRFVREHMESYGAYGFDRGFWTVRQVSGTLFRIGQLEYELTKLEGQPIVSLHIPTDVDLRPQVLVPSMKEGLAELYRLFPEYADKKVYCRSWLLSPLLKDFLPEGSNILRFQAMFDIHPAAVPGKGVLLWVFKNPKLPTEDLPEDTSLQRKLKRFLLDGGQFTDGIGYLR